MRRGEVCLPGEAMAKGWSVGVLGENIPSSVCPPILRDRCSDSMSYTRILPLPAPATTSLPSAENRILQI